MHDEKNTPQGMDDCRSDLNMAWDFSSVNALEPPFGTVKVNKRVTTRNTISDVVSSHFWDLWVLCKIN